MEPYMSGLFALGGTIAGGLITYFVQVRIQNIQTVRFHKELALRLALTEWEKHFEHLRAKEESGHSNVTFSPPTTYLPYYLPVVEKILQSDLPSSPKTLSRELHEIERALDTFFAEHPIRHHDVRGREKGYYAPHND